MTQKQNVSSFIPGKNYQKIPIYYWLIGVQSWCSWRLICSDILMNKNDYPSKETNIWKQFIHSYVWYTYSREHTALLQYSDYI